MTYRGAAVPVGKTAPIGPDGLVVQLNIPPNVELLEACLELQAPSDDVTTDLHVGAAIAADAMDAEGKPDTTKPLKWYTVDWGARRPLCSLEVEVSERVSNPAPEAFLEVADGGPWYSPLPGKEQPKITLAAGGLQLPGIMARRLMVRIPDGAPITSVTVKGPARPCDVSVSIGDGALFFHRAEPMEPLGTLKIVDELTRALKEAWPADLEGGVVPIVLRSSGIGACTSLSLKLVTADVLRAGMNGAPAHRVNVPTNGRTTVEIDVPGDGPMESVSFVVKHRLLAEQVSYAPAFPKKPVNAQLCETGLMAAQGFPALGTAPIMGVDLFACALTRKVAGTFALHADEGGRPAEMPQKGAGGTFEWVEKEASPWPSRWSSLDMSKPVVIKDAPFWVVLNVTEGALLWGLHSLPNDAPEGIFLCRLGSEPWLPRDLPWAYCRVRRVATSLPDAPTVHLSWGSNVISAEADARGRVTLSAEALKPLTIPTAPVRPPLEVLLRSKAECTTTIAEIRITSRHEETFLLFRPTH